MIAILVIAGLVLIYKSIFGISIHAEKPEKIIIIPTGSSYEQVIDSIVSNQLVKNRKLFDWVAKKKNYPALIKPGRYVIDKDFSYNSLYKYAEVGPSDTCQDHFSEYQDLKSAGR